MPGEMVAFTRTGRNKNRSSERLSRQLKLIALLRTIRPQSLADIAEQLGVSHRTVYRDIQLLQALGIPLEHHHGGYQINAEAAAPAQQLTLEQVDALTCLQYFTAQYRSTSSILRHADSALRHLLAQNPIQPTCDLSKLPASHLHMRQIIDIFARCGQSLDRKNNT